MHNEGCCDEDEIEGEKSVKPNNGYNESERGKKMAEWEPFCSYSEMGLKTYQILTTKSKMAWRRLR